MEHFISFVYDVTQMHTGFIHGSIESYFLHFFKKMQVKNLRNRLFWTLYFAAAKFTQICTVGEKFPHTLHEIEYNRAFFTKSFLGVN